MRTTAAIKKDLVLVGGGHSHLAVIRQFGMHPVEGVRVTVLSRDVDTPYSGMLPGLIAGDYDHADCFIDLRRLCQWAGARLFHSSAVQIDSAGQRVICDNRPPVPYDFLSINVGSTPQLATIAGASEHGVPVKPIGAFLQRLQQWQHNLKPRNEPVQLTVVGGGAASVELILALKQRLDSAQLPCPIQYRLLSAESQLLPQHNRRAANMVIAHMGSQGIELQLNCKLVRMDSGTLHSADGKALPSEFTVLATHAAAPPWLNNSGVDLQRGFVQVTENLQSTSHPNVFAAGDCASLQHIPLAKSGVYAVRQGPVLAENLRRAIQQRPLQRFIPQRHFLSLLSTGQATAIASRGPFSAQGAWVWRWKSRIDRRFVERYNGLSAMAMPAQQDDATMRCGGCGAKVGGGALQRVLQRLATDTNRGETLAVEDAAVLTPRVGMQWVQSIDHFRSFIDDPYLLGRIGANHCLGDIYAMGATPGSAMALANIPYDSANIVEDNLYQLMRGALETLDEAGTQLVGGHSSEAAELAFGLTVNGYIEPGSALLKSGLLAGQSLILCKPLGTGTLLAANMQHRARASWIDSALATMLQGNGQAATILRQYGATACTDITGFGLAGHLLEMLEASNARATIELQGIPLIHGAEQCLQQGIFSTLHPSNRNHTQAIDNIERYESSARLQCLFDPQTAGGLLGGVNSTDASECLAALKSAGYQAAEVGRVEAAGHSAPITLV